MQLLRLSSSTGELMMVVVRNRKVELLFSFILRFGFFFPILCSGVWSLQIESRWKQNSSCSALMLFGAAVTQEGRLAVRLMSRGQTAASMAHRVRGSELRHRIIRQFVFMSRQPTAV